MTMIIDGSSGATFPDSSVQASAGKVIQVVQAVKTDTFATTTGTTWADISGLSATITPKSATSKILVMFDVKGAGQNGASVINIRLVRGSTPIYIGDAAGSRPQVSGGQSYYGANALYINQIGGQYLDSPATTSPVTYKVQLTADNTSVVVYINRTETDRGTAPYDARTASSITLMEIAA